MRLAKAQFLESKIGSGPNVKNNIWTTINSQIKQHSKLHENIVLKETETNLIQEPKQIAEKFNDYFINVNNQFTLDHNVDNLNNDVQNDLQGSEACLEVFAPADVNEIIAIGKQLKNKKSFGHDSIPVFVVKKCINIISPPLTHIINSSMEESKLPAELKIAKVIPIYKKGDSKLTENYRPVSILPTFSKIFERVIYNRITTFLENNNKFNPTQFGFRSNKSTKLALVHFIEKIINALEAKLKVLGCFLDLSKACLNWIDNYLTNRKQYVELTHTHKSTNEKQSFKSNTKRLITGVPQGSILGPLLFLIYVNDII